nr:inovirus-type Gp2 protein [Xanthomonas massiliensis]
MVASQRRTDEATAALHRQKRLAGTSLAEYVRAKPVKLTPEGRREAAALGLVNYKTSDTQQVPAVLSLEIDPLLTRANRLRKSVITSARLHDQEAKVGGFRGAWYFLTLTYRDGCDSSPRHVSELLKRMRGHFNRARSRTQRWARESFRYVWVGELTQRLRPHYHVMLWVPRGMYFGKVDQRGWWPHGLSQIERARNCVGYLAKYASKFTSVTAGAFPKGFRTHGVGGLSQESRRELRWWKASKEAREFLGEAADVRKCNGGWFDRLTGEFWPSPWKVTFVFGRTIAWKLVTL